MDIFSLILFCLNLFHNKSNDYLTLTSIPAETWEYKLGNKSALNWIIDQYQIKTDKRSGIVNVPNQLENEMYIVSLIKKIVTVSVETVKLIKELELIELNPSPD